MIVAIWKLEFGTEWAPTGPEYTFANPDEDRPPYAMIDVPSGWMLVGEPPLLVKRTTNTEFTSRSATEALFMGLTLVQGFSMATKPRDGTIAEWNAEIIRRDVKPKFQEIAVEPSAALPKPSRNGLAKKK